MDADSSRYVISSPLNELRKLQRDVESRCVDGKIVSRADAAEIRFLCRLSEARVPSGQDESLDRLRAKYFSNVEETTKRVFRPDPVIALWSRRIWTILTPSVLGAGVVMWFLSVSNLIPAFILQILHSIAAFIFWIVVIFAAIGIILMVAGGSRPVKKDGTLDMRYKVNRQ